MSSSILESSPEKTAPKLGASVGDQGVTYTVWAPDHAEVAVRVRRADGREATLPMEPGAAGYFSMADSAGRAGDRYGFVLSGADPLPDPASRLQPDGVHGLSVCVDPRGYAWRCDAWRRPGWHGQSIYELHVGTFTEAGTFRAAAARMAHVASLGVGAIEIMPVADFPGERNWGYDGVALFAPARCYGAPDDLRGLVDAAHEHGLAVILDVVYNHLGPDGNYLSRYAAQYFDANRHTPWGQAFHLSGPGSRPVRDFFVANACYWLDEFRIDGLRLDATHAIVDDSPQHLLAEIAEAVHRRGAFVIAEDDRNTSSLLCKPDGTGLQLDGVWADDFHHQVRVALTGVQESYFESYAGTADDLVETLRHGWFYRGQPYSQWQDNPRGESCGHLSPSAFVYCIENHDQVGNRARGERLEHLVSASAFRAASALLCLSPYPPLIFMGQEWAASTPFLFFTDHAGELGHKVSEGRQKEFASAGLNRGIAAQDVPDPQAATTFTASKLQWDELRQYPHAAILELYRTCLRHRAEWLQRVAADRGNWTVSAVGRVVVIRYHAPGEPQRLVVSALQGEARIALEQEPAVRPPEGHAWRVELESTSLSFGYGGLGSATTPARSTAERRTVEALVFGAPATVLLVAEKTTARDF